MKIYLVILFFVILTFSGYSQPPGLKCNCPRPIPERSVKLYYPSDDTISFTLFQEISCEINDKMSENKILTDEEAFHLIEILNTFDNILEKELPLKKEQQEVLISLRNNFSVYYVDLCCRYGVSASKGFGIYFKEIKISYGGNPYIATKFILTTN